MIKRLVQPIKKADYHNKRKSFALMANVSVRIAETAVGMLSKQLVQKGKSKSCSAHRHIALSVCGANKGGAAPAIPQ